MDGCIRRNNGDEAGAKSARRRRQPLTSAGGARNQRQFPWLPGGKPSEPNLEQARARWPLVAHLMRRGPLWRTSTANRSGENLGPTQPVGRAPTVRENARVSHPSASSGSASMRPVSELNPRRPRTAPAHTRNGPSRLYLLGAVDREASSRGLSNQEFCSSSATRFVGVFVPMYFAPSSDLSRVCVFVSQFGGSPFRRQSIRPDALSRDRFLPPPVDRPARCTLASSVC